MDLADPEAEQYLKVQPFGTWGRPRAGGPRARTDSRKCIPGSFRLDVVVA